MLAQDLVKLALFDVCFLLDDSASMNARGEKRREALGAIVRRAADAAGRLDPDGMEAAWLCASGGHRIHNAQEARALVEACAFNGQSTPMGSALQHKILEPLLYGKLASNSLRKPILAIVITDGRPTGSSERDNRIVKVIQEAKARLASSPYGEDAMSIQIAAVGNDKEAQDWLDSIDSDPQVGQLVDVCSDIRVEAAQVRKRTGIELTEDLHCLKVRRACSSSRASLRLLRRSCSAPSTRPT